MEITDIENSLSSIAESLNTIARTGNSSQIIAMVCAIVSGVFVFLFCEYLKDIWLTPLQEYKKLKGKIDSALVYYAKYYCNVVDLADKETERIRYYSDASNEIRTLASELSGFIESLSWIKVGSPKKEKLCDAASLLIGLSNSFFCPYNTHDYTNMGRDNMTMADKIRQSLGIAPK